MIVRCPVDSGSRTTFGMRTQLALVLVVAGWIGFGPARSQESPSFRLSESVLNAGGRPVNGAVATSASFRIELDALGDAVSDFVAVYAPPGEVTGLRFDNHITLRWNAERSAGTYNLYRAGLASLATLAYGGCTQTSIAGASTLDTDPLASGAGYFYLVTVENRLAQEGTKGYRSDGIERGGTVCP